MWRKTLLLCFSLFLLFVISGADAAFAQHFIPRPKGYNQGGMHTLPNPGQGGPMIGPLDTNQGLLHEQNRGSTILDNLNNAQAPLYDQKKSNNRSNRQDDYHKETIDNAWEAAEKIAEIERAYDEQERQTRIQRSKPWSVQVYLVILGIIAMIPVINFLSHN